MLQDLATALATFLFTPPRTFLSYSRRFCAPITLTFWRADLAYLRTIAAAAISSSPQPGAASFAAAEYLSEWMSYFLAPAFRRTCMIISAAPRYEVGFPIYHWVQCVSDLSLLYILILECFSIDAAYGRW
ncbi:hypothetical protein [Ketogulonicigenium vulgare]|uniref:hypothetical protein n=1 Tax=Ketogulonicigenium vulgare TaxID=92945 RepID=UPI001872AF41|nr:hypothetical protein [Ketogulonicigenium vulgare]